MKENMFVEKLLRNLSQKILVIVVGVPYIELPLICLFLKIAEYLDAEKYAANVQMRQKLRQSKCGNIAKFTVFGHIFRILLLISASFCIRTGFLKCAPFAAMKSFHYRIYTAFFCYPRTLQNRSQHSLGYDLYEQLGNP